MLQYLIKIRRSRAWWRVEMIRRGLVSSFAFIYPIVFQWLKGVMKGKR